MISIDDQIRSYATAVAGPVLHRDPEPDLQPSGGPDRRYLAVAVCLFVLIAAIALGAVRLSHTDGSPAATTTTLDEEGLANRQLEQDLAAGWSPYEYPDPTTGAPLRGYLSVAAGENTVMPLLFDPVLQRVPVFAERSTDSKIVGYDYSWLGFVTPEVANSPTFDPKAARIERNGCDPLDDDQQVSQACIATFDPRQSSTTTVPPS